MEEMMLLRLERKHRRQEMKKMRLDKLLSTMGEGTRSEVRDLVRAGRVTVDGVIAKDAGMQVDAEECKIIVAGRVLAYRSVCHVMLNKPQGVLTAARDKKQKTVMDLFPAWMLICRLK